MFGWFKKKAATDAREAATPPESSVRPNDFSHITSRELAEAAWQSGQLQKLLLMPAEFGGEDVEVNVLYLPGVAADAKRTVDLQQVLPLAQQGRISRYEARPQYFGDSFVPSLLTIDACDPGRFTAEVRVWGSVAERHAATSTPGNPESVVRAFIDDYYAWNEEAAAAIDQPWDDARHDAIEAAYDTIISRHCPPGLQRQPLSYGSKASHHPVLTRIVSVATGEANAVVRTSIPMGPYSASVHVHEFDLELHDDRWLLTGVCLVDDEGRWPGL